MTNYYIIVSSKTQDGQHRDLKWNIDSTQLEIVLKVVRQLLIVLVGKNSNLYNSFKGLNLSNIDSVLPYSKIFALSVGEYQFNLSYLEKTALIIYSEQKIGVVQSDENSYQRVVNVMRFLIQLLEGDSSNIQKLDKIATGNYNLPQLSNTLDRDFMTVYSMFTSTLTKKHTIDLVLPKEMQFEIKIKQI
jgi:hypothetical protein